MTVGSANQEAEPRHRPRFRGADDLGQAFGTEPFPSFVEGDDPAVGLLQEALRLGSLASLRVSILAVLDLKDFNGGYTLQSVQIEHTAVGIEASLNLADCDDPVPHRRQVTGGEPLPWSGLEVASLGLIAFYGLEQRLEVANPEPARAVPFDDFVEHRRPVLDSFREDLQQIPLIVLIDENA